MAKEALHGSNINAVGQEAGGEVVAEGVGCELVREPRLLAKLLDDPFRLSDREEAVSFPREDRGFGLYGEPSPLVEGEDFPQSFLRYGVERDAPGSFGLCEPSWKVDLIEHLAFPSEMLDLEKVGFSNSHPGVAESDDGVEIPYPKGGTRVDGL